MTAGPEDPRAAALPAAARPARRRGAGKTALFWALQTAGWLSFGAAMLVWGLERWTIAEALPNKLLLVGTGFALTLGCRLLYRRVRGGRLPGRRVRAARQGGARAGWRGALPAGLLAVLLGAVSFGGAVLWIEIHALLLEAWYAAGAGVSFAPRWLPIEVGTLLFYGFVLLAWSLLYWGINAGFDLEEQRERAHRAEALAHQARLRALQSQLEPHFLFNTLNAVSTLVVERRNAEAARMISRLSDFLRLTLDTAETPEVSVAEELDFVRRYLEIEQVRFGDRLQVRVEAGAEAMAASVPALVLQPLVENAVKHGVLTRERGGRVEVTVERAGDRLRIAVRDDGPGLAAGATAPGASASRPAAGAAPVRRGLGLANTAARLAELYGEGAALRLVDVPGGGLVASFEIPFRVAAGRAPDLPPAAPAAGAAGIAAPNAGAAAGAAPAPAPLAARARA